MPDALSLQYCNLSSENYLKTAILHRRAENIKINYGEFMIWNPHLTSLMIVAKVF